MEDKSTSHGLQPVDSSFGDDYKHSEAFIEEVVIARLTEEDLWTLSQESLRIRSKTGFRISLIMFVQGCNQAGYGIDWAVISGINAFTQWVCVAC